MTVRNHPVGKQNYGKEDGRIAPNFIAMKSRKLAVGALIAALYAILTHLQNMILPDSATWAIQLRASEALCVLAFFTPAASWGLAVGCFLFNLLYAGALPLDVVVGPLASFLAGAAMYATRKIRVLGIPFLGMLMPAVFNAIFVGWELWLYLQTPFWLNALYVAAGELIVLLTLGTALYILLDRRFRRLIEGE